LSSRQCQTLRWSRGGRETGAVSLTVQEGGLYLRYGTKENSSETLAFSELIPFSYTGAGSGGRRRASSACATAGGAE